MTEDDLPIQPVIQRKSNSKYSVSYDQFRSEWYNQHPWLEYSKTYDKAFCFPCRHFLKKRSQNKLSAHGFDQWNRGNSAFKQHEQSINHMRAVDMWHERRKNVNHHVNNT